MKEFLIELFKQMSTGNFVVEVECKDNKCFKADIIGYDEKFQTISVRFHSDNLTKPQSVREENVMMWDNDYEREDTFVVKNMPIKEEIVHYKCKT